MKLERRDGPAGLGEVATNGDGGVGAGNAIEAALRSGDLPAAESLLGRLRVEALDSQQTRRLAWLARRVRDPELSLAIADRILATDESSEEALLTRALALRESGRTDSARLVIEQGPPGPLQSSIRVAARFFAHVNEPDRAERALAQLEAPGADLLVDVGRGFASCGELRRAVALSNRALEVEPGHGGALRLRERSLGEIRIHRRDWAGPRRNPPSLHPRPGRVLHLVNRSLPRRQNGYTLRTHSIARAQRQAGLDPHVAAGARAGPTNGASPSPETLDGVPYHGLAGLDDSSHPLDARLSLALEAASDLAKRLRPAVVHAATPFTTGYLGLELGRRLGLPVVYEHRGFRAETRVSERGGPGRASDRYERDSDAELRCMAEADMVVTLAEVMKAQVVAGGISPDKVVVVPNAVDTEVFAPPPRDQGLATALGMEADDVVIGYISGLKRYEGVRYLIEAVAELRRRGMRVHGLIVGDGSERLALERLSERLGLGGRITFTGQIEHADVLRHYGLIDCFVVPRTADAVCQLVTPLKPFEAMATARTVVVSGTDALREIVRDGETGLVFEPESVESLVRVLEPLVEDRARREELGAAAREWVVRERTWRGNVRRYVDLYDRLGAL